MVIVLFKLLLILFIISPSSPDPQRTVTGQRSRKHGAQATRTRAHNPRGRNGGHMLVDFFSKWINYKITLIVVLAD